MGAIPGQGRSHIPQGHQVPTPRMGLCSRARGPQLLKPVRSEPVSRNHGAGVLQVLKPGHREPGATTAPRARRSPCSPQPESPHAATKTRSNPNTKNPQPAPTCIKDQVLHVTWRSPAFAPTSASKQPFPPDPASQTPPGLLHKPVKEVPASGLWHWPRPLPGTRFPQAFACLRAPLPQAAAQTSLPALSGTARPPVLCSAAGRLLQLGAQGGPEGTGRASKACGAGHPGRGLAAGRRWYGWHVESQGQDMGPWVQRRQPPVCALCGDSTRAPPASGGGSQKTHTARTGGSCKTPADRRASGQPPMGSRTGSTYSFSTRIINTHQAHRRTTGTNGGLRGNAGGAGRTPPRGRSNRGSERPCRAQGYAG